MMHACMGDACLHVYVYGCATMLPTQCYVVADVAGVTEACSGNSAAPRVGVAFHYVNYVKGGAQTKTEWLRLLPAMGTLKVTHRSCPRLLLSRGVALPNLRVLQPPSRRYCMGLS